MYLQQAQFLCGFGWGVINKWRKDFWQTEHRIGLTCPTTSGNRRTWKWSGRAWAWRVPLLSLMISTTMRWRWRLNNGQVGTTHMMEQNCYCSFKTDSNETVFHNSKLSDQDGKFHTRLEELKNELRQSSMVLPASRSRRNKTFSKRSWLSTKRISLKHNSETHPKLESKTSSLMAERVYGENKMNNEKIIQQGLILFYFAFKEPDLP